MQPAFRKLIFTLLLFASSCTTAPVHQLTPGERFQQDSALGLQLSAKFQEQVRLKEDEAVQLYLEELGKTLVDASPELNGFPIEVRLIDPVRGKSRNFGLPGNRLYLERRFLKEIRFENELAALIALELGHLERRTVLSRLEKNGAAESDLLGPQGLFALEEKEWLEGLSKGMEMLYRAGYDPRGMVMLLTDYQKSALSPWNEELVQKGLETARRVIALHAPLRNPIVRSERFLTMKKRIQQL